ncbi:MAG: tetratricopeptide repeat-containing serine/threonine-protein kinase [Gemmatimonadota bacterium]|nr:tetratricopeptide repeat-containing serine/threonine-protein kinase [Gemmatimonadota bacterium]
MSDASASLANTLADRYTIERVLGHGGMATVHLAEERKHKRKVAIKVLKQEFGASVGAERFLREIGIAARLSHPHIVPLIDSGESDGSLYYVSPYIAGGSLRERLNRDRKISIDDALRIVHEVGAALDYAHRNGFVHRDVKPENILFADDHALLADFGIAHVAASTSDEPLTLGGLALGTPEYMSPEQASGETEIGVAGDVYGLACVFYEMLAGEPPFRGATPRATMAKQVTEKARPLRILRPDAPAGFERVLEKALAKDPVQRFPSVVDFCDALSRARLEPNRPFAAATRTIAVLPFVNSSPDPDNEYLSDGITDELINALAKVEGLRVASRTSVFALKGKAQDVRAIGALLEASEVLEGSVRRSGENLRITAQLTSTDDGRLVWSERYDRKLHDVFAIQDEIARTIVTTLRATSFADIAPAPTNRHTENVQAYGLYLRGRYAWNKRTSEGVFEGIKYFEEAIALDPTYALAYTGLADSYSLHIDYRNVPVHEGHKKAKFYARKAIELDDALAEAHASLAWSLFVYDWDKAAAAREFRRAIALDAQYAPAHQWYAFMLASQGKFDEALLEAHTAQENDPSSVSVRRSLGYCYVYARKYEQARYHLSRAIAMNPTAEESYRIQGLILTLLGEYPEAERTLREALDLASPGSTYTKATLAYSLARGGNTSIAAQVRDELLEKRKHDYVSPVELATVNCGLGDVEQAIDWCEQAAEERRGWVMYLAVHPVVDPLRGEPRFQALVRKMGLDGIRVSTLNR